MELNISDVAVKNFNVYNECAYSLLTEALMSLPNKRLFDVRIVNFNKCSPKLEAIFSRVAGGGSSEVKLVGTSDSLYWIDNIVYTGLKLGHHPVLSELCNRFIWPEIQIKGFGKLSGPGSIFLGNNPERGVWESKHPIIKKYGVELPTPKKLVFILEDEKVYPDFIEQLLTVVVPGVDPCDITICYAGTKYCQMLSAARLNSHVIYNIDPLSWENLDITHLGAYMPYTVTCMQHVKAGELMEALLEVSRINIKIKGLTTEDIDILYELLCHNSLLVREKSIYIPEGDTCKYYTLRDFETELIQIRQKYSGQFQR